MKHGSEWYKREPAAYLGGVQGMTAKEHAVYSVTLDLIYQHGGSVNNDPSWIAGWIKDMGAAAVRKALETLACRGKLVIDGDQITQKRAKTEAKTKENVTQTARESGKKGGKKSAELRATLIKNNDLAKPHATPEKQADKTREDKTTSKEEAEKSFSGFDCYLKYFEAHPKSVESKKGEDAFDALVKSGVDAAQIIASASKYAETVKGWSAEAKVQQSDNFLDEERGKWREFVPKAAKAPPTEAQLLAFYAETVIKKKPAASSTVSADMARRLIAADLVTTAQLKAARVAQ